MYLFCLDMSCSVGYKSENEKMLEKSILYSSFSQLNK